MHATTILMVRKGGRVVIGGDGQVSLGQTIMKGNARKVRRLANGQVIAGFAGTIQARYESNLGFRVPGRIARRAVDVGAEVSKGALLASISSSSAL